MSEPLNKLQDELAKLIKRYSGRDGVHATSISSLYFMRQSTVAGPVYGLFKPSLCILVQGVKDVWLAHERFRYSPADYLVASVDLPVIGQVVEASAATPYLAIKLEFTPRQILDVLTDLGVRVKPKENSRRAMFVSRIELPLLDAVVRLCRLQDNPRDIPVLAPLFTREILYRVLQGQHRDILEQIAVEGSNAYRIGDVIKQIMSNYNRSLRIEELAKMANMSVPTLHRHFKEVTAMSPIQFQKQLRLQEARRLLLADSTDAADVAFRVGYESPSQFSREYSRLFGLPPIEDIKRVRAQA